MRIELKRGIIFISVCAVPVLFMLFSVGSIASAATWNTYYLQGVQYYKSGDFKNCAAKIELALSINSDSGVHSVDGNVVDYYPHWYLCESYTKLGEDEKAECHCAGAQSDSEYKSCIAGREYDGNEANVESTVIVDNDNESEEDDYDSGLSKDEVEGESGVELIVPDFDSDEDKNDDVAEAVGDKKDKESEESEKHPVRKRRVSSKKAAPETEESASNGAKAEMSARIEEMRRRAPKNAANPNGDDIDQKDNNKKKNIKEALLTGLALYAAIKLDKDKNTGDSPAPTMNKSKNTSKKNDPEKDAGLFKPVIDFSNRLATDFTIPPNQNSVLVEIKYMVRDGGHGRTIKKIISTLRGDYINYNSKTETVCNGKRNPCGYANTFSENLPHGKYYLIIHAEDNVGATKENSFGFWVR